MATRYDSRLVNEAGNDLMQGIKELAEQLAQILDNELLQSRERSLAQTELQTAVMWAIRAVANEYAQEVK